MKQNRHCQRTFCLKCHN